MYEFAIFLHILAGIAWFGTGLFYQLHTNRLRSVADGGEVADVMESFSWAEKWIFIPAPLLVLATGIVMVLANDAWAFSQLWVYLAISLWVAEAILGGAVGGKLITQISETRAGGGDVSPLVDQYLYLAWIDIAILTVILYLMVFKPGL